MGEEYLKILLVYSSHLTLDIQIFSSPLPALEESSHPHSRYTFTDEHTEALKC